MAPWLLVVLLFIATGMLHVYAWKIIFFSTFLLHTFYIYRVLRMRGAKIYFILQCARICKMI